MIWLCCVPQAGPPPFAYLLLAAVFIALVVVLQRFPMWVRNVAAAIGALLLILFVVLIVIRSG